MLEIQEAAGGVCVVVAYVHVSFGGCQTLMPEVLLDLDDMSAFTILPAV